MRSGLEKKRKNNEKKRKEFFFLSFLLGGNLIRLLRFKIKNELKRAEKKETKCYVMNENYLFSFFFLFKFEKIFSEKNSLLRRFSLISFFFFPFANKILFLVVFLSHPPKSNHEGSHGGLPVSIILLPSLWIF